VLGQTCRRTQTHIVTVAIDCCHPEGYRLMTRACVLDGAACVALACMRLGLRPYLPTHIHTVHRADRGLVIVTKLPVQYLCAEKTPTTYDFTSHARVNVD